MPSISGNKVLAGGYAAVAGVGATALFSTGTWFSVTPAASAGLGAAITGTTAIATFTSVGIISAAAAVPIAWLTYKGLTKETDTLTKQIPDLFNQLKLNREKLFYELLRLRFACKTKNKFNALVDRASLQLIPANRDALKALVNRIYDQIKNNAHSSHAMSLTTLLQHSPLASADKLRDKLLQNIKQNASIPFDKQLQDCFECIAPPNIVKRAMAALYGMIAGLTVSGATLGVGWSFASLVIGAGLTASIPVVGWAIFAAICIALGIGFGVGMGLNKQNNLQREALIGLLTQKNGQLEHDREKVSDVCINKMLHCIKQNRLEITPAKPIKHITLKPTPSNHQAKSAMQQHHLHAKKAKQHTQSEARKVIAPARLR